MAFFVPRGDGFVDFVDENDNVLLSGVPERAALELGGQERPRRAGEFLDEIGIRSGEMRVPRDGGGFEALPDRPQAPSDVDSPFIAQGEEIPEPLVEIVEPEPLELVGTPGPPPGALTQEEEEPPVKPVVAPLEVDLSVDETAPRLPDAPEPQKEKRIETAEEAFVSASDLREKAIARQREADEEAQAALARAANKSALELREVDRRVDELSTDVDPGRVWKNANLFQKAMLVMSAAIDGYLNPGGKNGAVDLLMRMVDRDTQAQLDELERQRAAIAAKRQVIDDETEIEKNRIHANHALKLAKVNSLLNIAKSRTQLGGDLIVGAEKRGLFEELAANKERLRKQSEQADRGLQLKESQFLANLQDAARRSWRGRGKKRKGDFEIGPMTVYGFNREPIGNSQTGDKVEVRKLRSDIAAYGAMVDQMYGAIRKLKGCKSFDENGNAVTLRGRVLEWSWFRGLSNDCLQRARAVRSSVLSSAQNFAKLSDRDVKIITQKLPEIGDLTSNNPIARWLEFIEAEGKVIDQQVNKVGINWRASDEAFRIFGRDTKDGPSKKQRSPQQRIDDAFLGLKSMETSVILDSVKELIFDKDSSLDDLRKAKAALRARRKSLPSANISEQGKEVLGRSLSKAESVIDSALADSASFESPFEPIPADPEARQKALNREAEGKAAKPQKDRPSKAMKKRFHRKLD